MAKKEEAMVELKIETLARRLDRVERENRRMKQAGVVAFAVIAAFSRKVAFHGDGDFADGRRMLEPREEEVKESFGVLDGES